MEDENLNHFITEDLYLVAGDASYIEDAPVSKDYTTPEPVVEAAKEPMVTPVATPKMATPSLPSTPKRQIFL